MVSLVNVLPYAVLEAKTLSGQVASQKNSLKICHFKVLLHFVAFFHVASLLSTGVDNKKVGVDNEKGLELDNRIIFFHFSA